MFENLIKFFLVRAQNFCTSEERSTKLNCSSNYIVSLLLRAQERLNDLIYIILWIINNTTGCWVFSHHIGGYNKHKGVPKKNFRDKIPVTVIQVWCSLYDTYKDSAAVVVSHYSMV